MNYQEMNDNLLKTMLDRRFFNVWKKGPDGDYSLYKDTGLELFITPECNKVCSYCYLWKNKGKLYPEAYRNWEQIMSNLRKLFDYALEQKYKFYKLELFSGEIWHEQKGLDILNTILEYVKKGLRVEFIIIPTNCTFIKDKEQTRRIQKIIDDLRFYKCVLNISASVDGAVIDKITRRDINEDDMDIDEFYERLMTFNTRNGFLYHPMVSAASVPYWKENLDWWRKKLAEFGRTSDDLMMLEVRNDGEWTDEALEAYGEYLRYELELLNQEVNNDKSQLARYTIGNTDRRVGYCNFITPLANTSPGCTLATTLSVRLGDLAIAPCHRTSYEQYLYGRFKVEDDKIVGIHAINPNMAIKILYGNMKTVHHGCDACLYNEFCLRGCVGAQLEAGEEPFMPLSSVCKMLKYKYNTSIKLLEEYGVFEEYRKFPQGDFYYNRVQRVLKAVDKIKSTWKQEDNV